MNYIPPRPSGSTRFSLFCQAIWDGFWGTESIFVDTPDGPLRFQKFENGKYLPVLKREASSFRKLVRMYVLIEEFDDYLRCAALTIEEDGTRHFLSSDDTDVYIAKPADIRHSITAQIIDGDSLTYSYADEHTRTATIDEGEATEISEVEVVSPWYLPEDETNDGNIIYAVETVGTGVFRLVSTGPDVFEQLTLLEISGREWARSSTQPAP